MDLRWILYRALVLWFSLSCVAFAGEPDAVYMEARRLATTGHTPQSLALLEKELRENPTNVDVRMLYGIILSWEHRYDDARLALDAVLETSPKYHDARMALIRVELWSDHPSQAEFVAREGLKLEPSNPEFLLGLLKALSEQKHNSEALEISGQLLAIDPRNKDARRIRERIAEDGRLWEVETATSYTWFNGSLNSGWRESDVAIKGMTPVGRVIFRFDQMTRNSTSSQLLEVEAYPRLRPGTYMFLNAGFSPDHQLYPSYRFAGDIYQNLPSASEVSVGLRAFNFGTPFFLYTGSAGRYFGSYLIGARTFISHDSAGLSTSMQYSVRRYYGDHEKFVSLQYGHGPSPFEVRNINEVGVLKSNSVTGEVSAKVAGRILYTMTAGFSFQDRLVNVGVRQYILEGSFSYKF